MKLTRFGHHKSRDTTTLVSYELTALYFDVGGLEWQQDPWGLSLRLPGLPGEATYNYDLAFSADELARLVERALLGTDKDVAIHTHAKGLGAFIREVLDKKNQASR